MESDIVINLTVPQIMFSKKQKEDFIVYKFEFNDSSYLSFALDKEYTNKEYVLASIRTINLERKARIESTEDLIFQTKNLKKKLITLNKLDISENKFSDIFAAGRIFSYFYDEELAWNRVSTCLDILKGEIGKEIIYQPDYDQMKFHKELGGILDNIDFKTKHVPSALGTITAYSSILSKLEIPLKDSKWAIVGVGNLGGIIVKELIKRDVKQILIYDKELEKLETFKNNENIVICDSIEQLCEKRINSIIFAANSGSLNNEITQTLAKNTSIILFGGPEAALDRSSENINELTSKKKIFIPSLLCGALGLISNLEEVMRKNEDFEKKLIKLTTFIENIYDIAQKNNENFHITLEKYLQ